ncbi:MAG TPA: hypothetical protein VFD36_17730, partial [Kofleriaceae bacterium]|nr:hypothetical protein [Kofleriaceae bacterium]
AAGMITGRSQAELDDAIRRIDDMAAQLRDAIARGKAAQDDAERRAAQSHLLQLQQQQAALAEQTRRRAEEQKRRDRLRPVIIPAACLHAAVCK